MDIPIPLIVILVFVLALASLLFVYKYGIKEKSYEEALAEQRQQTNALLGARPKPKEKKAKKVKKVNSILNKLCINCNLHCIVFCSPRRSKLLQLILKNRKSLKMLKMPILMVGPMLSPMLSLKNLN